MLNYHKIYLSGTDSTNNYLKKLSIEKRLDEGTVILSGYQSEGRGQGNNNWHSEPGKNLLLSIIVYPDIEPGDFFALSAMFSLTIKSLLEEFGILSSIKWPNDIYVDDRKIAGILIENSIMENKVSSSILGVGININQLKFPEPVPNPVSMAQILHHETPLENILESFEKNFTIYWTFLKQGHYEELLEEYNAFLYRKGILCKFCKDEKIFNARIISVLDKGQLVLQDENNNYREFLFNDIKMLIP